MADTPDPIPAAVAQIVSTYLTKTRPPQPETLCDIIEAVGASLRKIDDSNNIRPHGRDVWKNRNKKSENA